MKKIFITLLAIFTMLVGINRAYAEQEQGYITVGASSQIELVPDVVDFSVEIITTSKESMQKAIADNKKISGKIYEDLKNAIDKTNGDSIKTSNYSANPVYRYNNNKRILDYYQVKNNIKIHTKKIAEVGKIIDIATDNGATSVNNVTYSVSKYDDECNKLYAETAQKARKQAENIIASLGGEIAGIKSVDCSSSLSGKTTMPRLMLMAKSGNGAMDEAAVSEDAGTNIEVGTMTLYTRITVHFYVK